MKLVALLLTLLALTACGRNGPAENLGEGIDDAVDEVEDALN
jgi:hypothetical protein